MLKQQRDNKLIIPSAAGSGLGPSTIESALTSAPGLRKPRLDAAKECRKQMRASCASQKKIMKALCVEIRKVVELAGTP
jgi:hypothetical protein